MGGPAEQQEARAGVCRPGLLPAWASVHRPSETCFPLACSKVCIHSHEAQTIRQQHDTINQNQTSKRVFVGTSKLCNVPPRAKEAIEETCADSGVGGGGGVCMFTKDAHQMARYGLKDFHK